MYIIVPICVFLVNILHAAYGEETRVQINMTVAIDHTTSQSESKCTGHKETYVFTEGTLLKCVIRTNTYTNYAWQIVTHDNHKSDFLNLSDLNIFNDGKTLLSMQEVRLRKSHEGLWQYKILNHFGGPVSPVEKYDGKNYTVTYCNFRVNITNKSMTLWESLSDREKYIYVGVGVTSLVLFIIGVQTGIILHYKAKAQAARVHQNLSTQRKTNDKARYSVGFRKKPSNRDSGLYETLEEVKIKRSIPPIPPAIETLPKHSGGTIEKHRLSPLQATSCTNLLAEGNCDETLRIQNRPPVPLPEEYEEVGPPEETYEEPPEEKVEENTYEPPPEFEARKAAPPPKPETKKPLPTPLACRTMRLNTLNPSQISPNAQRKNGHPKPKIGNLTMPKASPEKMAGKNQMAAELSDILQRRKAGHPIMTGQPISPVRTSPKTPKTIQPGLKTPPSNSSIMSKFKKPIPAPANAMSSIKMTSHSPNNSSNGSLQRNPRLDLKLDLKPTVNANRTPPITPLQGKPVLPLPSTPGKLKQGFSPTPTPPFIPPPNPANEPIYEVEPNSSDEEWNYEPLPEIKLNKPVPKQNIPQVLPHAPIPQLIPPPSHQMYESSNEYEVYSSDEEWMYEELPEIKLNKHK